MIKAYKYKILPSEEQKQTLIKFFGCTRYIYNWGLNIKTQSYKEFGKSVSYNDLAKQLTALKQQNETSFLCECANESLQQSLRNLENAFTGFFVKNQNTQISNPRKNQGIALNSLTVYILILKNGK